MDEWNAVYLLYQIGNEKEKIKPKIQLFEGVSSMYSYSNNDIECHLIFVSDFIPSKIEFTLTKLFSRWLLVLALNNHRTSCGFQKKERKLRKRFNSLESTSILYNTILSSCLFVYSSFDFLFTFPFGRAEVGSESGRLLLFFFFFFIQRKHCFCSEMQLQLINVCECLITYHPVHHFPNKSKRCTFSITQHFEIYTYIHTVPRRFPSLVVFFFSLLPSPALHSVWMCRRTFTNNFGMILQQCLRLLDFIW